MLLDQDCPLLIITARIGSRRFPEKVLKKIWRNYSILEFIIRRFQRVPEMSRLCLATAGTPENDTVSQVGEQCGIPVIRGPEDDVVGRMALCLRNQEFQYVGRITADNPLTDPILLRRQWFEMIKRGADYSYCKSVSPGLAADLWTRSCFEETVRCAAGAYEREHANAHVWNNEPRYRVLWFGPDGISEKFGRRSLTVDTLEDFMSVRRWIDSLKRPLAFSVFPDLHP